MKIKDRVIGEGHPTYIIAEMSANHAMDIEKAKKIIHEAKNSGADCIKIQTYTPDTLTIDCDNPYFMVKSGTWVGEKLYDLYGKAYTPWEWHEDLKNEADSIGIDFLSTAYDTTAVDFLEKLNIKAYKIASFEMIDIPLIKYIASKNKPIIMSTGLSSLGEIEASVKAIKSVGNSDLCILKCSSAYPADPKDMNLRSIPILKSIFQIPVGLSDHTLGPVSSISAVSLGADLIEKHLCLSRKIKTPDSSFSMEPHEFKNMVDAIRTTEVALGNFSTELSDNEKKSIIFRRSLFVIKDMKAGEKFTEENTRIIRPGYGLSPKYVDTIIDKKIAIRKIKRGTPLSWDLVSSEQ